MLYPHCVIKLNKICYGGNCPNINLMKTIGDIDKKMMKVI